MAELTFKSPGVSTREIDLSGPSKVGPVGVPAGVIGTAAKGRAFVPLVFANLSEFVAEFGAISADKFGPMALREWFTNARAGLYLRVLGAGDGKARIDVAATGSRGDGQTAGSVNNAGFVVGSEMVDPNQNGQVKPNSFAGANAAGVKATGSIVVTDAARGNMAVGDTFTIVSTDGTQITYTAAAEAVAATRRTNKQFRIDTLANFTDDLKDIINEGTGASTHKDKIKAASTVAGTITLTQEVVSSTGNTEILFNNADLIAHLAGVTVTDFTGGVTASGIKGRTHFLGCLMKERDHGKGAATFAVADGDAVLALTTDAPYATLIGKSVTIISTDGTSKQYVFTDSATDAPNIATGDVLAATNKIGDLPVAATDIVLAAGDSRIGGIAVSVNAGAVSVQHDLLAQLKVAVNATAGHNAGVANSKVTLVIDTAGDGTKNIVLTQTAGKDGNTQITSTVTLSTLTQPAAFTGGDGERVFQESGVGSSGYAPVLRGVLMFPSGVVPSLSASRSEVTNNTPVAQPGVKAPGVATIKVTDGDETHGMGEKKSIKITDTDGVAKTYVVVLGGGTPRDPATGGGTLAVANGTALANGSDTGDGTAGAPFTDGIAVNVMTADTQNDFLVRLKAAIEGSTGHNGSVIVSSVPSEDTGNQSITLTQNKAGATGNTVILNDIQNVTPTAAAAAATSGRFKNGANVSTQLAASATYEFGDTVGIDNGGSDVGAIDISSGKQEFVVLLNGHKKTSTYPNAITASFDPQSTNYFPNVLNTDPTAIQDAGHYLYTHYGMFSSYATPVAKSNPYLASGYDEAADKDCAFMVSAQGSRNAGTITRPNTECFSDRYRTAVSPTIVSQKFGGQSQDLFKVHSLDDGSGGNVVFKITIENIRRSQSDKDRYGTFDLLVRSFDDSDREPIVLERFSSLSLDTQSDRYVARIVGDYHLFYDFDKRSGSQKLTLHGKFENNSRNIRIEVSDAVANRIIDATALPMGFRGIPKLNIDNAGTFAKPSIFDATLVGHQVIKTPPLPMRRTVGLGTVPKKRSNSSFCWGVQFEADDLYAEPNKNTRITTMMSSLTKYFPDYDLNDLALLSRNSDAADSYNNNAFAIENIQIVTNASNAPDSREWSVAEYRRNGVLNYAITDTDGNSAASKTRFLNSQSDLDLGSVRRYLKFTAFVQGGFDGLEIFDKEKASLSDTAIKREVDWPSDQGGKTGPTAATFMKATDVLAEKSDVDIQLLAIPGIRQTLITDKAIESVEDRFDAMFIMDAIVYDADNLVITGSSQKVSVTNTVSQFSNRVLDSSFAAAYFPDVILQDPATGQNVQAPPSVPVLGAFSLNDQLAHPWYAPAGFTRGAMGNVVETQVKLNRDNLDSLYEADINPLTSFPHTAGVVVFGQKTLLRTQSSLDRVNVRRLLIEIRRRVRNVANSFIFEPNREATLARFSAQVHPILRQIQQQQGVDRFLVRIDTTTTTQNDVENNTLRGKIFLQPTRSVEFISLDFVITNAGAEI